MTENCAANEKDSVKVIQEFEDLELSLGTRKVT